ncbi:Flp pilus assembly protein CpaB [Arthrobacter sp. FW305-BF8]|uniref:Flp pilus assembly protein CpaB n=1 Tax=Arthrobacter sp. FW305-BF8 TaxID=2879617 RepID=UPI001F1D6305|nr:RcpC/CpaB family pilus assembly protein [Arthrobacter sp. FW305-BF8]
MAIIGTVLLVNYVQNADKRALADTETESVYVVEKTITAGTGINKAAGAVVRKEVPKLAVAAGAVTDLNQVGQKVAAVDLMPGEQLLATRMVDANALLGPARAQVPGGMQEISLKLPIERVVGGTLAAGDTVGVFLSVDDSTAKTGRTQLTFHKVLVTAAQFSNGSTAKSQEAAAEEEAAAGSLNTKKSSSSDDTYLITLARNSADAERIVFATEFGKVYLSREPANAVESTSGVVTGARLFR